MEYPKPKKYIERIRQIPIYDCPECGAELEGRSSYSSHMGRLHSQAEAKEAVVATPTEVEETVVAPVVEETVAAPVVEEETVVAPIVE